MKSTLLDRPTDRAGTGTHRANAGYKPIGPQGAGLRTAYAAVFVVAISQLVEALRLHTQALRQINTFTDVLGRGARPVWSEPVCPGLHGLQKGRGGARPN